VYQILPNDKMYDDALSLKTKIKIIDLLRKFQTSAILISSSSYPSFGEIITYPCKQDIGYDLYELSSLGLNVKPAHELQILNKLTTPEVFSNFTDRTFQPNFGRIEINWNTRKNKTIISLEIANKKGEILVGKTRTFEDFIVKNKTGLNMRECTNELYYSNNMIREMILNFFNRIIEPEFLPMLVVSLSTVFLMTVFTCVSCGCFLRMKQRMNVSVLSEYEHFHRD